MLKSLRNRLILSHILPLLITLPLMGIGLIYILETQVYLPALATELENDARFFAQITTVNEEIWYEPAEAQAFVDLYKARDEARMMLLDPSGALIASSDPNDQAHPEQVLDGVDLAAIRQRSTQRGGTATAIRKIHFSPRLNLDIIDIFVPVNGEDGEPLGFVRISYPITTVTRGVYRLRFLILILLAVGLLLGSGLGYLLAVSVSTPIREVTRAISTLARNSQTKLLTPYGPEEIQSLTRSVNEMVTRLREMEQSRRQLLANLVHELGRPLGAIRSATTALAQGAEKDPELYHDLVKGMNSETGRLQHLLNDLAKSYDIVLGTVELDRQPINLKTWLPEILSTWQIAALEKGIQMQMVLSDNPQVIYADPDRLAQVVSNLVSNAIKFSSPGGTVYVSTVDQPGEIGIAVRDTGQGISRDEQEKIWQPFYRGSHDRRFPEGMGLGLSIARDITKSHGGHLELESIPGEGSTFTVWLPASTS